VPIATTNYINKRHEQYPRLYHHHHPPRTPVAGLRRIALARPADDVAACGLNGRLGGCCGCTPLETCLRPSRHGSGAAAWVRLRRAGPARVPPRLPITILRERFLGSLGLLMSGLAFAGVDPLLLLPLLIAGDGVAFWARRGKYQSFAFLESVSFGCRRRRATCPRPHLCRSPPAVQILRLCAKHRSEAAAVKHTLQKRAPPGAHSEKFSCTAFSPARPHIHMKFKGACSGAARRRARPQLHGTVPQLTTKPHWWGPVKDGQQLSWTVRYGVSCDPWLCSFKLGQ
jgi:hypothetical protein